MCRMDPLYVSLFVRFSKLSQIASLNVELQEFKKVKLRETESYTPLLF